MAYARKRKVSYEEIVLTMTPEEAQVLRTLIGHFVNGAKEGPRGKTTSIWKALKDQGVEDHHKMYLHSTGRVTLYD